MSHEVGVPFAAVIARVRSKLSLFRVGLVGLCLLQSYYLWKAGNGSFKQAIGPQLYPKI